MKTKNCSKLLVLCLAVIASLSCTQSTIMTGGGQYPSGNIQVTTISGQPDMISGGDVLVRVTFPRVAGQGSFYVALDGTDVTKEFYPGDTENSVVGLVTDLKIGDNTLEVKDAERHRVSLTLTNYPIQGPIVSGPHVLPFVCQTAAFLLPDGTSLGQALDSNCSVETRVNYVYMSSTAKSFKALESTARLPEDTAVTTTMTGAKVNFVVRIETATINRGIYQSAILHDPTADPKPTPLSRPKGWNRVLLGVQGFGCTGGWYVQGGSRVYPQSSILDAKRLSQGYALYANTLQNPSDSCNAFLAGETAMMGKEHFIKTYGVPRYSLSLGNSGGAYTGLQIIDAFPGLFDGALISATFPDALAIALSGMDAHLLTHYFSVINPGGFTIEQQVAVSGYGSRQAWYDAASQANRTDPISGRIDVPGYSSAVWNPAVPASVRYDPVTNPSGARPTIWDAAKTIYGSDTKTGFAMRVFDNVGIQYGLGALNAGMITKAQFLDLNSRVGGYDRDDNYVPLRTLGDQHAISEAYSSGLQLSGGGGLAGVPVLDVSGILNEAAGYHYQWYHFALRERMIDANGDSGNLVMWRGEPDPDTNSLVLSEAFDLINQWVSAVKLDSARISLHRKVINHRPTSLVDGCWQATHRFIAEPQVFGHLSNTKCNVLWPSYAFPRFVAGGPLAANNLKCRLKPIGLQDYAVSFTGEELQQLHKIFTEGVCDWSKSGVDFHRVIVGRSYGPAPSAEIVGSQALSLSR